MGKAKKGGGSAVAAPVEVADDVEMNAADAEPKPPVSLEILNHIKNSQNENGLHHSDYQRYRQYCSRRLRRVRKNLKISLTGKTFKKRDVQEAQVSSAEWLMVPLMNAERAWSYAMQLKGEMQGGEDEEDSRKRVHLLKRLGRAASYSSELERLCAARGDTRTQLEAEAYNAWMHGGVLLERDNHSEALAKFLIASKTYERLGQASGAATEALCRDKVAAIQPSIRYCQYVLKKSGNTEAQEALLQEMSSHDELLRSKLQHVIADQRKTQARALDSVEWQGKQIPIKNEKLRVCIVTAREFAKELREFQQSRTQGEVGEEDKEASLYQEIFSQYEDALRHIRSDLRELGAAKMKGIADEHLLLLQKHCASQKLSFSVERSEGMVRELRARWKQQESGKANRVQGAKGGQSKKVKPDDIVHVCERVVQALDEQEELDGATASNAPGKRACATALRCFYVAESYRRFRKWTEAYVLYDRCLQLTREAAELSLDKQSAAEMQELGQDSRGRQSFVHATAFLEGEGKAEEARKGLASVSLDEHKKGDAMLLDRLGSFEPGSKQKQHDLVEFPPAFQAAPCKPALFDLAWNSVECNDISHRFQKKTKKEGLFGFRQAAKGFLGWS